MIQKRSIIGAAAFFIVMALTVGWFALAADIGGRENPLVTLDYLKSLDPQIEATIAAVVGEKVDAEAQRFQDMLRQAQEAIGNMPAGGVNLDELLQNEEFINGIVTAIAGQYGLSAASGLEETGTRHELRNNQTIRLAQGSRVVRRLGAATVVNVPSGQGGLVDVTAGTVLAGNGALAENHEYIVTFAAGREIRSTSDSTVLFIWGSFTIVN
jgi:hypothetical protein